MFFLSWGVNFWPKNVVFGQFDNVPLIFEDGISQKFGFLGKKCQTLMANFGTSGQIFKLQKSKLVRISSPIHWNHPGYVCTWIRIRPQKSLDPKH